MVYVRRQSGWFEPAAAAVGATSIPRPGNPQ
jgi:hypothetical protein